MTSGPIISEKQAKTVPARKILQEVLSAGGKRPAGPICAKNSKLCKIDKYFRTSGHV